MLQFDVATVTWDEEPARLMAALQPLVGRGSFEAPSAPAAASTEDTVDKLKSPKRGATKCGR